MYLILNRTFTYLNLVAINKVCNIEIPPNNVLSVFSDWPNIFTNTMFIVSGLINYIHNLKKYILRYIYIYDLRFN